LDKAKLKLDEKLRKAARNHSGRCKRWVSFWKFCQNYN